MTNAEIPRTKAAGTAACTTAWQVWREAALTDSDKQLLSRLHEPENVAALGTDVVRGLIIGPIEVEERSRPGVKERIAFMKLLVSTDRTRQLSFTNRYLDCAVTPLDLLKVHRRRISSQEFYRP